MISIVNVTLKELEQLMKTYYGLLDYWIFLTEIGQEEGLVTDKVKQYCYCGF